MTLPTATIIVTKVRTTIRTKVKVTRITKAINSYKYLDVEPMTSLDRFLLK